MSIADSSHLVQSHPDWVSMDVDRLGKSFYYNDGNPLSESLKQLKHKTLNEAIKNNNIDFLKEHSRSSEGLMDNELRCKIWPLFLEIPSIDENSDSVLQQSASCFLDDLNVNDLPPHRDEEQIKLDIKRSFTIVSHLRSTTVDHSSFTGIYSSSDIDKLKRDLLNLLVKMFRTYPALHYYQGYHDIASIILLVCQNHQNPGDELAFRLLERLSLFHLRDFMITDINLSTIHLKLIPALLEDVDPTLYELLKQTSNVYRLTNGALYDYGFVQGLSSILTMFSHDINNLPQLLMTWDFILSYNSISACAYVYTAALLFSKDDIFRKLGLNPRPVTDFSDVDPDAVHSLVSPSTLFANLTDQDMANILHSASQLSKEHPLDQLSNNHTTFNFWFGEYNPHSVLKTTSTGGPAPQSYYSLATSNNDLAELIQTQDQEVTKQTLVDSNLLAKIMDLQDDSVTDDYSPSESHSLSSSISSLASGTSSVNTRIAEASSQILKRLLHSSHHSQRTSPEPGDGEKKRPKGLSRIYKVSLTVGFVGFMIHFLLTKRNPEMIKLSRLLGGDWSIGGLVNSLSTFGGMVAGEAKNSARHAYETISEQARINFGQVGLGTLRATYFDL
ncbi:hypothetical protein PGUG_00920 [Meyerozyma guilliermondii ATCC 6260]|uniref:Rab-GAP TBC domain-containing protein n=1 Tax=Meyerozyma guilliermondii (strain ATCC 6260 / CBS 566 / DSM 6381 / JCM 1539 / NBRC 10279 / NRRL Y-324) TaxID=294746 RepID=A5DCB5_PICGU|nr:uncharacterized protein PGUG_00920 [Meyerozyma guilliermondii ATCC 6260]EDK36822.2 hypothetical protein PGUG_00920 [Meyerozyma guilliermondii ATCC 6260]